jgi:hypothetical protein
MRRAVLFVAAALLAGALVGTLIVLSRSPRHDGGTDSATAVNAAERVDTMAPSLQPAQAVKASKLALAGDRLDPGAMGEIGMLEVALGSLGVERRIETQDREVLAAVRLRHLVVSAGGSGDVQVWRPSGALLGKSQVSRPLTNLVGALGLPLCVGADRKGALTLIDLSDPHHPRLFPIPDSDGFGAVLAASFTAGGSDLYVVRGNGELEEFVTRNGRRRSRFNLIEDVRRSLGGSDLGELTMAQPENGFYEAPHQLLLGFSSGAVVRVGMGGGSVRLLVAPGFIGAPITSLSAVPAGGEVAAGTKIGLVTLEHPGSAPSQHLGPPVFDLAFGSEGELFVAGPEGVEEQMSEWESSDSSGIPSLDLSSGEGGVLALDPGGIISLLGPPDTGLGLPGSPAGPAMSFLPGGDLAIADGPTANTIESIDVVHPGHKIVDGYPLPDPEVRSFAPAKSWWPTAEEQEEEGKSAGGLYVNDIAVDPELLAAGGQDPTGDAVVLVWDTHTAKPVKRLPLASGGLELEEPSIVADVVLAPQKHLLAAYSASQQLVAIWSTKSWKLLSSVPVGDSSDLAISPDESQLVVIEPPQDETEWGSQRAKSKLTFIDTGDGRIDHEVIVPEASRVAWSPNGQTLALLGLDGTVRFRSRDGLKELRPPIDLDGEPHDFAWRPDGDLLAVSIEQSGVVLVDPVTSTVTEALPDKSSTVFALSWSDDGRFLADEPATEAYGGEGYVPQSAEIWGLSEARLKRRMCALAGGPIRRTEWASAVAESSSYRPLCARHEVVETAAAKRPVVLGAAAYALNGIGWGAAEPKAFSNGGDLSGYVGEITWRNWGAPTAVGVGRVSIFKLHGGGYYRHPVVIHLRAQGLGHCGLDPAYTRLSVRAPDRPGGPLQPWSSWGGTLSLCGTSSG